MAILFLGGGGIFLPWKLHTIYSQFIFCLRVACVYIVLQRVKCMCKIHFKCGLTLSRSKKASKLEGSSVTSLTSGRTMNDGRNACVVYVNLHAD